MKSFKEMIANESTTMMDVSKMKQGDMDSFIDQMKEYGMKDKDWSYAKDGVIEMPSKYKKHIVSWKDVTMIDSTMMEDISDKKDMDDKDCMDDDKDSMKKKKKEMMKKKDSMMESEEIDEDDYEEYDLVEYYGELMEDFKDDLDDLRGIIKALGMKNEVATPINEISTMIDRLDDQIQEAINADEVNTSSDKENEGKW